MWPTIILKYKLLKGHEISEFSPCFYCFQSHFNKELNAVKRCFGSFSLKLF